MRRARRVLIVGIFLLAFAAVSGWLLVIDQPQHADVIIVLAGETDKRPLRAIDLYHQGFAPHIILDVPANTQIYQWTQLQLAQMFIDGQLGGKDISVCPIVGLSTRDESHDTIPCLQGIQGKNVLLVTSDYHTRRALAIFRHELKNRNFSVAAAYDSNTFGEQWWRHREWAKTALGEWTKLLWWEVVDRWRS
jgi:uncharacterized SAM-binding protein YcdF (DUF218 family)